MNAAALGRLKSLAELYRYAAEAYPNEKSFLTRGENNAFSGPTYRELFDQGLKLAAALVAECGLKPGEHVALLADNRLEWILADYAVILAGAVDVPRGTDATPFDIEYILNHAGCRIVIAENRLVYDKLTALAAKLPLVEHVVSMEDIPHTDARWRSHSLQKLIEKGESLAKEALLAGIESIKPTDMFTLIYTSGTTGSPKGVMLTHDNIMSQVRNMPLGLEKTDVALSILPVWHIFERSFEIITIACGAKTAYTNVKNARNDLATVRPTLMASAPRLWESVYNGILTRVADAPAIRRGLFAAATKLGHVFRRALREIKGQNLKIFPQNPLARLFSFLFSLLTVLITAIPAFLLDAIVLKKIRLATGGRLRATISGGGALPLHIDEFFNDIGIPVLEGYGLTETSPTISVRTPDNRVIGTVGPLFKETEIRIVDLNDGSLIYPGKNYFGKKGELHMRGPQLMAGYYKNPEATARVIQDGWFNTGDLVVMTANHCLKIVGRSKETVVLLNGENVEPVPIESKILESKYIEQCMVVGQDQKFLGVLVVPRADALQEYGDLAAIARNEEVKKIIRADIARLISADNGFKAFERIGGIAVLDRVWEKDAELTGKLSLKRHVITEKYRKEIKEIYAQ